MNFGTGKLFGLDAVIAFHNDTVLGLYFCSDDEQMMLNFDLEQSDQNNTAASTLFENIESGKAVKFDFLAPSDLERQVWNALCEIESGTTATYGDIAQKIGRPSAVRAVASAIGRNPISYIVPCHRILRRDGTLGGYRWGLDVKRSLLARESRT